MNKAEKYKEFLKDLEELNNIKNYEQKRGLVEILLHKLRVFFETYYKSSGLMKEISLWGSAFYQKEESFGLHEILRKNSIIQKNKEAVIVKSILEIKERISLGEEKNLNSINVFNSLEIIQDKQLLNACKTSFIAGEYWDSCSHAFRHLESRIRTKGGFPQGLSGIDLVNSAFSGNNKKLTLPFCGTEEEEKGFHLLNMGIVKFHRNAKLHREGQIGKEDAMKIIGYIDYLLSLINTCEIKEEKSRDLLGGKSKWGGPILYGTPEQKLEQLKGYGGESIEKMREEKKKKIEEDDKSKNED